jgi:hypothetical protein
MIGMDTSTSCAAMPFAKDRIATIASKIDAFRMGRCRPMSEFNTRSVMALAVDFVFSVDCGRNSVIRNITVIDQLKAR